MKTKLIKLSDTHYIVVDDSDIQIDDLLLNLKSKEIHICCTKFRYLDNVGTVMNTIRIKDCEGFSLVKEDVNPLKITYSTQPLDIKNIPSIMANIQKVSWKEIKPLSLTEVEEAINGYSVEKIAKNKYENDYDNWDEGKLYWAIKGFIDGFNEHKELTKNAVFTVDDMRKAWNAAYIDAMSLDEETYKPLFFENFIQSLLSKTEWDIEINEKGKITIL